MLSINGRVQQCISPDKACRSPCLKNDDKCDLLYARISVGGPRVNTTSLRLSRCGGFRGTPLPGNQPDIILYNDDDAIQHSGLKTWHPPVIYLKVYHKNENPLNYISIFKLINYFFE